MAAPLTSGQYPIAVAPDVAADLPDVEVLLSAATVGDLSTMDAESDRLWRAQHEVWSRVSRSDVRRHPHVLAYRQLSTRIGINPDRQAPSVQALVDRALRAKPVGAWPRINPVVDLLNAIAVTTMIALGAFDADRVTGQVRLRRTEAGEQFHALGADSAQELETGSLVLADDTRVLSLFCYRDGVHQAVTADTRNVLVLGCRVFGVDPSVVATAVAQTVQKIARG
jgi:DNA/RNA-binding domain of Phe-tRNA-synthetase-like protein